MAATTNALSIGHGHGDEEDHMPKEDRMPKADKELRADKEEREPKALKAGNEDRLAFNEARKAYRDTAPSFSSYMPEDMDLETLGADAQDWDTAKGKWWNDDIYADMDMEGLRSDWKDGRTAWKDNKPTWDTWSTAE